jgi:hypothetical protein
MQDKGNVRDGVFPDWQVKPGEDYALVAVGASIHIGSEDRADQGMQRPFLNGFVACVDQAGPGSVPGRA